MVSPCFGIGAGSGFGSRLCGGLWVSGPGRVPENSISEMALNHLDVIIPRPKSDHLPAHLSQSALETRHSPQDLRFQSRIRAVFN